MFFTWYLSSIIGTSLMVIDRRRIVSLDDIAQDAYPDVKLMVISGCFLEQYFEPRLGSNKYTEVIQRKSYGDGQSPKEDNFIGLLELGNQNYLKSFLDGKLAILGDDYLVDLMVKSVCQVNKGFEFHISRHSFMEVNAGFAYSKCVDPNVRKILDQRLVMVCNYIIT